jgi:hypothetical protein
MGDARGSGLKQVNSLISPHSKSSSLNSRKFEGIWNNPNRIFPQKLISLITSTLLPAGKSATTPLSQMDNRFVHHPLKKW